MLAKEIKIKTLKKQREFIREQLNVFPTNRSDGNSGYIYVGYIHPEVIKYFESEGFVVTCVKSDLLSALTKGMPVYLFTIGDIELSEEELKQAEEYEPKDEEDGEHDEDEMPDFLKALLSGPRGMF